MELAEASGSGEPVAPDLSEPIPLRVFHGMVISLDVALAGRDFGAMLDTGSPLLVNAGAAADVPAAIRAELRYVSTVVRAIEAQHALVLPSGPLQQWVGGDVEVRRRALQLT